MEAPKLVRQIIPTAVGTATNKHFTKQNSSSFLQSAYFLLFLYGQNHIAFMTANGYPLQKHGYLTGLHLVCQAKVKSVKIFVSLMICEFDHN